MNDRVTVTIEGGVADVRLTRADKMNAIDDAMFDALIQTGERLKTEAGVRAVVLSGEGRAFCAGLDIDGFQSLAAGAPSGVLDTGNATRERSPGGAHRVQQAVMVWAMRRNERLVEFVHQRRFANAGVAREEQKFGCAGRYDHIAGPQQTPH